MGQKTLVLVSPNGSRVFLIDAIKDEYKEWNLQWFDLPEIAPVTAEQPEPQAEIEPVNVD